jgi:hypothetical protein
MVGVVGVRRKWKERKVNRRLQEDHRSLGSLGKIIGIRRRKKLTCDIVATQLPSVPQGLMSSDEARQASFMSLY